MASAPTDRPSPYDHSGGWTSGGLGPERTVLRVDFLDFVDRLAPHDVFEQFYDLLEALTRGPYPDDDPSLGILPLQDPTKPNGFTAPFDAGLLAYQVMKDQAVVKLVDVFWMNEGDDSSFNYAF